MYRRALASVEHTVLYARLIRSLAHLAAESVKLTHEVSLARTADGGVARHIADGIQVDGKANRFAAEPRSRQGCFDPGVSCANDADVISSGAKIHGSIIRFVVSISIYFYEKRVCALFSDAEAFKNVGEYFFIHGFARDFADGGKRRFGVHPGDVRSKPGTQRLRSV